MLLLRWLLFCGGVVDSSQHIAHLTLSTQSHFSVLPEYVSFTLDWWGTDKPGWGHAGLLNLNLDDQRLNLMAKALSPAFVRVGGTLSDTIVFVSEDSRDSDCIPGVDCLTAQKLEKLLKFVCSNGNRLVFSVNEMFGRKSGGRRRHHLDPWDSSNSVKLLTYLKKSKWSDCVFGFQLGNELNQVLEPDVLAADFKRFKKIIGSIWGKAKHPKLIGPDPHSWVEFVSSDMKWVCEFVNRSSPALDVLGYHMYVLGSGSDSQLVSKLTSPYALSRVSSGARVMLEAASNCTMNANKRIQVWASESSSANSSGRKNVTNTFANSFWYVDQLGQLAKLSHSVFCRQAFIGGFYEMIDQRSLEPNPDFWIALLWKRIMGPGVVSIEREHWSSSFLRVYSHVSKTSISFALSNLHEVDSFKIYFNSDGYGHIKQRNEYVLSPPDGDILSQQIHLNQRLLSLNPDGTLPGLEPIKTKSSSPMILDPRTIVFVEFMLPEAAIDATF